ncbi:hypothetical protein SDJN03_05616, partial [Cucurbita argyrosperma subsp. sororia]
MSSGSVSSSLKKSVSNDSLYNDHEVNVHRSPSRSGLSTNSALVCSFQCCTGCLDILYDLTKNILLNEFGSNRNNWTVEDLQIYCLLGCNLLEELYLLTSLPRSWIELHLHTPYSIRSKAKMRPPPPKDE